MYNLIILTVICITEAGPRLLAFSYTPQQGNNSNSIISCFTEAGLRLLAYSYTPQQGMTVILLFPVLQRLARGYKPSTTPFNRGRCGEEVCLYNIGAAALSAGIPSHYINSSLSGGLCQVM